MTSISAQHSVCLQDVVYELSEISPKVHLKVSEVYLFQGCVHALSATRLVETSHTR